MQPKKRIKQSERGASIVEIVIVIAIISILSAITVMSLLPSKKYKAEDQAFLLIDLMREAQQRSFSQKKTMKVQIDSTNRLISLINENEPADADNNGIIDVPTTTNDVTIKSVPFNSELTYVGLVPTNMTTTPVESTPVLPISSTNGISVMRFKPNGTVHNAGTNDVGQNSIPTGSTVYVWTKQINDATSPPTIADILRAVTVIGSSGSTKLWKCATPLDTTTNKPKCSTWTR